MVLADSGFWVAVANRKDKHHEHAKERADELRLMARNRDRMVHFYDDISTEELYGILTEHLADIPETLEALRTWIEAHPDRLRGEL